MSLEFKKLSEVEQIETASDNATVLVEEGGEIKRVPKKEVGGAGGYIATYTSSDMESPAVDGWDGPVLSENYDELYDVLCAGGSAWIDMTVLTTNVATAATGTTGIAPTNTDKLRMAITAWMITDIGIIAEIDYQGTLSCLFPNGSHNLEPLNEGK